MAPKIKRPLLMSREEFDAVFGATLATVSGDKLASVLMHMRDVVAERIGDRRAARRPRDESKEDRQARLAAKEASRAERRVVYDAYMLSPLWKEIRARVLQRDKGSCLCCGENATQVHHRNYSKATMSGSSIKALASICRKCHDDIHSNENGTRCSKRQTDANFMYLVKCFNESKSCIPFG